MSGQSQETRTPSLHVVFALGEKPSFQPGDQIRVLNRSPVAHYRVPIYLRGCKGIVESIINPPAVDNEEEGFGRNAGTKRHYYRVAVRMTEVWPDYVGSLNDEMRIEIYESWLERV